MTDHILPHNAAAMERRADAQGRVRRAGAGIDVSALPSFGFGHRSLMWWGTLGLIAIESTVFALTVGAYFYLRSHAQRWPMALDEAPPSLLWGTLVTVVLLASLVPMREAKKAAEALDLPKVRLWITVGTAVAIAVLVLRVLEFKALHCQWDSSAYGSVVWTLLGLHTLHLLTDGFENLVLNVLVFTGPLEGKRFGDVSEDSLYWYFVVWSWVPIYAVIYWAPRGG
jgi:heme/copper-type cytochrome/quinol oxidase subunit 3